MNPTDESLQIAAQAWCAESTEHKVMDVELATEFARLLDRELATLRARVAELEKAAFDAALEYAQSINDARDEIARLREVRGRGCQCGDDEACEFVRERDAAMALLGECVGPLFALEILQRQSYGDAGADEILSLACRVRELLEGK